MKRICISKAALAVLTCVALGCGGGAPKEDLVPVSGTVKIGGKPVEGVHVTFRPLAGTIGNGGFGVTDENGEYEMTHQATQKPGIVAGKYSVLFSRFLTRDGKPVPEGTKPHKSGAQESIRSDWTSVDKVGTHNTVTVPEGGDTFDFDVPEK